jgi:hypothetical protein
MMTQRRDYRAVHDGFDPTELIGRLDGELHQAVNACVECCDRHVGSNAVALIWGDASGERATRLQSEQPGDGPVSASRRVGQYVCALRRNVGNSVAAGLEMMDEGFEELARLQPALLEVTDDREPPDIGAAISERENSAISGDQVLCKSRKSMSGG